jgi:hypothetical protein
MTTGRSHPTLRDIFDGLQARLEGDLKGHRHAMVHSTARGEAAEEEWIRLLQAHLPHRYQADRAFVIDAHGGCSDQIDLVIYDRQYSPLLYNQANQRYVPAESVYAIFEVKQSLNNDHLRYAANKAASVRRLQRSTGMVWHLKGTDTSRSPKPILAGILCYESEWKPPFGESFRQCLSDLRGLDQLNIGCALRHGMFEVPYPADAEGHPTLFGEPVILEDCRTLLQFLLRLLKQLQPLGSAPAIDYGAYLSCLDE